MERGVSPYLLEMATTAPCFTSIWRPRREGGREGGKEGGKEGEREGGRKGGKEGFQFLQPLHLYNSFMFTSVNKHYTSEFLKMEILYRQWTQNFTSLYAQQSKMKQVSEITALLMTPALYHPTTAIHCDIFSLQCTQYMYMYCTCYHGQV